MLKEKAMENVRKVERKNVYVSNVVRNILEDTFGMVDKIGGNVESLVGDVLEDVENMVGRIKTARKERVENDKQDE